MTLFQWLKRHLFCAACGVLRVYPAQCRQCKALICDLCAAPYGRLGYSPGVGLCPTCRNAPSHHEPPPGGSVIYKGGTYEK